MREFSSDQSLLLPSCLSGPWAYSQPPVALPAPMPSYYVGQQPNLLVSHVATGPVPQRQAVAADSPFQACLGCLVDELDHSCGYRGA
jgi:hypothetical protein